jgi:hypothetical protein
MLSNPYQSKTTAKKAAKSHAQDHGLTKFSLIVDIEKKQYFFSDEDKAPELKMIVFGKFQIIKGKWRDRTPLRKVTCSGNISENK